MTTTTTGTSSDKGTEAIAAKTDTSQEPHQNKPDASSAGTFIHAATASPSAHTENERIGDNDNGDNVEQDDEDEEADEEADEEPDEDMDKTTTAPVTTAKDSPTSRRLPKKRRMVAGEKADLYSHFETLNEKAYTKGGRDLGLYLCICKYCQQAYLKAKQEWDEQQQQNEKASDNQRQPEPPHPFPRTRRYCVNHQKQCPHVPKENNTSSSSTTTTTTTTTGNNNNNNQAFFMSLLQHRQQQHTQEQLLQPPKQRPRISDAFLPTTTAAANATATLTAPALTTTTHTSSSSSSPYHANMGILPSTFEVYVAKDTFKFNAAHFVAFAGYRERLHGHNYTISVRLQGSQTYIGADGYVIDYGNIKKVCKGVCKDLNEHFLCPLYSDVLRLTHLTDHRNNTPLVRLDCLVDGTYFVFPVADCKFLPIVHATTEELAIYLWAAVMQGLDASYLLQRGIQSMELTVAEAPGQQATFRHAVQAASLDVRAFITKGPLVPQPCLETDKASDKSKTKRSDTASLCCNCEKDKGGCFSSAALTSLTAAMKSQGLLTRDVTVHDLQTMLKEHGQSTQPDGPKEV